MMQLRPRFEDKCGHPLAGGNVFAFEAGTSNPKATYADAEGTIPNTHPIKLDYRGEADIFLLSGRYRFVVYSCTGVKIYDVDDVGEWLGVITADRVIDGDKTQHQINEEQKDKNTSLEQEIASEVKRATGVEENLTLLVQQEKDRATAAEVSITELIDAETIRATQAEQVLDNKINANGIGNRAYKTYAAMDADKANIPAKSKVTVTNDSDQTKNGDYQWDGTTFTKSAYNPVSQAAADATAKANAAESNAKSYADGLNLATQTKIQDIERTTSVDQDTQNILSVIDEFGFQLCQINPNGLSTPAHKIEVDTQTIERIEDEFGFVVSEQTPTSKKDITGIWENIAESDYKICDEFGFVAFSAMQQSGSSPADDTRASIINNGNSTALAISSSVDNKYVTGIARPVYDYNIVVVYGQSLSTGTEGWPSLTKTSIEPNILMFGDSTQPNTTRDNGGSTWNPVGTAELKTLRSAVHTLDNTSILTDAEVAALAAGATNEGESVEHGAVNFWRKLQNDFRGLSSNPNRKIIVVNCGVQGRTIQQLSKNSSLNHFNRIVEAVTKVKNYILSLNPSATIGHVATLFLQGEYNYAFPATGETKDVYKSLQLQLREDIHNSVTQAILNQSDYAAFITYQTNGDYTSDALNLHVGVAQLEISNETNGFWLASPDYHVTDKGGHLDSNGYRWLGMYFGRVLHQILDRGVDWKPLQPYKAVVHNDEVFIHFLVPSPPLIFKNYYRGLVSTANTNKGFRVEVNGVTAAIQSVSIVASATVAIKLANKPAGEVVVWYADKTSNNGAGNLCDSDAIRPTFNYEYIAGSGQYPAANIPELVNKPYPLNNFCTAFRITATQE